MVKKPMKAAGPLIFAAAIAAAVLISVSGIRCYADRLHGACIARGQLACRCADVV